MPRTVGHVQCPRCASPHWVALDVAKTLVTAGGKRRALRVVRCRRCGLEWSPDLPRPGAWSDNDRLGPGPDAPDSVV